MSNAVLGFFPYVDRLVDAAGKLKKAGFGDITVFSPIPIGPEIDPVLGEKKNPIKFFTLLGGITGLTAGTTLAFVTAALYILPRAGKPIFPVTPTVIISYEVTILLGVFATLLGFIVFSRLPSFKEKTYDVKINIDQFALLVKGDSNKLDQIEKIIKESGANEVKRVEEK